MSIKKMHIQDQFYEAMSSYKDKQRGSNSRAASTRVTEVLNGIICSKAASAPGINKLKEIQDFINSHGRRF
jgi:hypothetical protein